MEIPIRSGHFYQNLKTGDFYFVMHLAKHSETGETLVVYRRLDVPESQTWVRPLEIFRLKFRDWP